METGGCLTGTVGRIREDSPPLCHNCLPCVQTCVRCGVVVQAELIHLPVWPNPYCSLF